MDKNYDLIGGQYVDTTDIPEVYILHTCLDLWMRENLSERELFLNGLYQSYSKIFLTISYHNAGLDTVDGEKFDEVSEGIRYANSKMVEYGIPEKFLFEELLPVVGEK